MVELLRETRRLVNYLRGLEGLWAAIWEEPPFSDARDQARDAYDLAAEEFDCFTAELESRLPACVVDRIDQIAYRSVYGGAS